MAYQKILAALDRSSHSEEVFAQALDLAQQNNAALMLFHCLSIDQHQGLFLNEFELTGEPLAPYAAALHEEIEQQREQAQQWLSDHCQQARDRGLQTEWNVKLGEPGKATCDLAASWGAEVIILGRRGLTGMMEMLMGSVSNYVVHRSPCAVLVVQGKDESSQESSD